MSLRLTLFVTVLLGLLLAYLGSLNMTAVRFALARDWTYDLPLVAVVIGAFLAGAVVTFALGAFRDLARTVREYGQARRGRRAQTIAESYGRGRRHHLAGRPDEASRAYEEALRRDPAHAEAAAGLAELARERGDFAAALDQSLRALRAGERVEILLDAAADARRLGRLDDAVAMYRRVLERDPDHLTAWRGVRDVAAERGEWAEARLAQDRLLRMVPRASRSAEETWRAGIEYEIGRTLHARGDAPAAAARFKEALRIRPDFLPAALALGDVYVEAGELREAARVWERALAAEPASPLLSRVERLYRSEGRPSRMISLYEEAAARHPDNLAVAFGLGRVYFELAMLDEAADHFEKLEVRAPDLVLPRAYLGAIFERHGRSREAFEEYRRALHFPESAEWPHRCAACGAIQPSWFDRCPGCRLWNTSRP